MIAEILSVGTELLMGNIVNTNAQYISEKLCDLGVNCYFQTTVGDNHDRLVAAVETALSRADILILTGGLGPTADDLTKETIADAFGRELVLDPASEQHIHARFARMGREMTPNNLKQAMFPRGGIILPNPNGTAPGCIVEEGEKAAILLPGPPKEMAPMFDASVMPYLEKRSGHMLVSHVVRVFGMGESEAEYRLRTLMERQSNPTIAPYALSGEMKLRVTARCKSAEEGERMMAPLIDEIKETLGSVVYSIDDQELHEVCAALLREHGATLAVAESCTGGMIASKLVSVPGISAYFIEGAVTYSNDAKIRRLGVRPGTLAAHTAVSAETAREMAEGIRRTSGASLGVATTGIAGPDGRTVEQPVGLVYIALASESGTAVQELRLTGSRERIRNAASLHALNLIRRHFFGDFANS
jgi:putative competence-damage inducible protein